MQATAFQKQIWNLAENLTGPEKVKDRIQTLLTIYLDRLGGSPLAPDLEALKTDLSRYSITEVSGKQRNTVNDPFFNTLMEFLHSSKLDDLKEKEAEALSQRISSEQFPWVAVNRDEMLRVLIHLKDLKRKTVDQSFDCEVLQKDELEGFLNNKVASLDPSKVSRFQVLSRDEVHYTALDFEYHAGALKCVVMDAYQEPKHLKLVEFLLTKNVVVLVAGSDENDKLQYDTRSCSIFSLDHLVRSSTKENFFEFLDAHATFDELRGCNAVSWRSLEPEFVKNAQNPAFTEENPGIQETLELYKARVTQFLERSTPREIAAVAFQHFPSFLNHR